ncbi:MAG TPA: hypothetical protein VHL09_13115, partial [Dehalococcoidia bacterium]|nr:hypothetical protein [Dehalococcoidia bacterium]
LARPPARPSTMYHVSEWPRVAAAFATVGRTFERIWLVRLYDTVSDPSERVIAELGDRFQRVLDRRYPGSGAAQVRLYRTLPPLLADLPFGFHPVDVPAPSLGRLVGWRWVPSSFEGPPRAILQLAWQASGPTGADLRTFAHVLESDRQIAGRDVVTGAPLTTRDWRAGQVVLDEIPLELSEGELSRPVEVGLYDATTGERHQLGGAMGWIVGTTPIRAPDPVDQAVAAFANGIDLVDVQSPPSPVAAGSDAAIRLTWRLRQSPAADQTVFVHLVDASGRPIAQADGPLLRGRVPPDRWLDQNLVREERIMSLPSNLAPGTYQVRAGWYALPDGMRFAVEAGAHRDNAVLAGVITVAP